jgi:hypothetical protein
LIFDRRPFYLIAAAAGAVLLAVLWFAVPRIGPDRRVREQLALLAREPWTEVLIERVEYRGAAQPLEQAVLHGVRLDTNAPVQIQFIGKSPYTAESAMKYLGDHALDGATADVLMLPRSIAWEPYRSQFAPATTHVGVAVFAGLAEAIEPDVVPAAAGDMSVETPTLPAAGGDMSVETPTQPAATPPAEAPPTPPPPPHG